MKKHTYIDKETAATGHGDLEIWHICAEDDGSILATAYCQHLAEVIQNAVENDIESNERSCWQ